MKNMLPLMAFLGFVGCQNQTNLKPVAAETVTATYSRVLYAPPSPTPAKKPSPTPTATPKPKPTPVVQKKNFIETTETTTVISTQPVVAPDNEIKPSR